MSKPDNYPSYNVNPIGFIRSPFKEKFGLPRQSGLVSSACAYIEICSPYSNPDAFEGLADFSHIWVSFVFHQAIQREWKPKIRPPRLGGNEKVGVFASRSPYRPNHLGQSVVALKSIDFSNGVKLEIECPDMVDGTPVIDIKPYLAYCESIAMADCGYAQELPHPRLRVRAEPQVELRIKEIGQEIRGFYELIREVISLDPRPAYQRDDEEREYGVRLYDYNIRFIVQSDIAVITEISNCE